MKNSLLILCFFALISCKTTSSKKNTKDSVKIFTDCKIYKIDSIGNYYLVYAIDNKFRYKIVSKKENNNTLNLIKLNLNYKFNLEAVINLDSISHRQVNYLDFKRCHVFFPQTEICNEPSIELYKTKDLTGLNYNTKK